jgi:SAM-dependent methyltransferase
MYDSKEEYFRIGADALRICLTFGDETLLKTGNILDFPSGYGRVLRHLNKKFPNASLFACELDSRMLDFTKEAFSAYPRRISVLADSPSPVKLRMETSVEVADDHSDLLASLSPAGKHQGRNVDFKDVVPCISNSRRTAARKFVALLAFASPGKLGVRGSDFNRLCISALSHV